MSPLERATPAFADVLACLHRASFPQAERWGRDALLAQLALPGVFGFVAPAGGFVLARLAADEAEILTLAVAPPARRAGLGRHLVEHAMAEAAARGAAVLFLEVSEANAPARALYRVCGFHEVGRRPRYYADGADALVLRAVTPSESRAG